MEFYQLSPDHKNPQIKRIMEQSKEDFSDERVVADYQKLYNDLVN
jgi:hypothetical protein